MRTQLAIAHALLSDPAAGYRELGLVYYDQRADTQRQARAYIRSLERLWRHAADGTNRRRL